MKFVHVRNILEFPLSCFLPVVGDRAQNLYQIRLGATRTDGFFLIRLDKDDHFASSFTLQGVEAGEYLLGHIEAFPSKAREGQLCYDVYVHGGARDATCFCPTEVQLIEMFVGLETNGASEMFTNDTWEGTIEDPFGEYFDVFPVDQRFVVAFSNIYELEDV